MNLKGVVAACGLKRQWVNASLLGCVAKDPESTNLAALGVILVFCVPLWCFQLV